MNRFIARVLFLYLTVIILVLKSHFSYSQVLITNKSFEGPTSPLAGVVPSGWSVCFGSPDTQPGAWCNNLPANDGNTYIGIIASAGFDGAEEVGQNLTISLIKDIKYKLTINLSQTNSIVPNCGGIIPGLVNFELWAGSCACCKTKLLAKVDTVKNIGWKTYSLLITPDANYSYILLQSNFIGFFGTNRYLLIDNLSDFVIIKPTIQFSNPSNDSSVYCGKIPLRFHTDSLASAVSLKSTLLNQSFTAAYLNDTTWEYNSIQYPVTCKAKTDTLILSGTFTNNFIAYDTLLFEVNCVNDTCSEPIIPNLVTPNGDQKNDYFEILNLPASHKLEIYNRWGQRVLQTSDYKNNWNSDDGVYYFILTTNEYTYKGWVQVIR